MRGAEYNKLYVYPNARITFSNSHDDTFYGVYFRCDSIAAFLLRIIVMFTLRRLTVAWDPLRSIPTANLCIGSTSHFNCYLPKYGVS
jgi:hypothetical protein